MDRILLIRYGYGKGKMMIDVNKFFPTTKTRIRKLEKIMTKDYDHDLKSELLQMLDDRVNDDMEKQKTKKALLENIQVVNNFI